jgi:hypothetical protein
MERYMFEEEQLKTPLVVTVHRSNLNNTQYARTPRCTATIENVIHAVLERSPGISRYMMYHCAELFRDEMIAMFEKGMAVEVLGLCTMYPAVSRGIDTKKDLPDSPDIPGFTARFTPSEAVKKAAANISVQDVVIEDSSPKIRTITDWSTGKADGTLTQNEMVCIKGRLLKQGGKTAGIYFAPLTDAKNAVTDESQWIQVDRGMLAENLPKTLVFKLPPQLTPGTAYRIVVRTSLTHNNTERRTPGTGISKQICTITAHA